MLGGVAVVGIVWISAVELQRPLYVLLYVDST
jgi:hypothetical protein